MYFWDIKQLKSDLKIGLNKRQNFIYILIFIVGGAIIVSDIVEGYFQHNNSYIELIFVCVSLLITLIGTVLAFISNGGAKGLKFAERYFSISWVMSVRFMVLSIVLMPGAFLIISIFDYLALDNIAHQNVRITYYLLGLILVTYFYSRVCFHIRSLSK